jgi:ComF family protein
MLTFLHDVLGRVLTRDRCVICDESFDTPACASCRAELPWTECRDELPDGSRVIAAWRYEEPVASAVRRLKYEDRPDLAVRLASLASPAFTTLAGWAPDLIVPVPLHPRRLAERGFNQAALLARAFRAQLGPYGARARVAVRALRRRVDTGQLAGKRRVERRCEVGDAFVVRQPGTVAGRCVVLVDDVVTTGATVEACAAVLRAAGATVGGVLALCRTVGRSQGSGQMADF